MNKNIVLGLICAGYHIVNSFIMSTLSLTCTPNRSQLINGRPARTSIVFVSNFLLIYLANMNERLLLK